MPDDARDDPPLDTVREVARRVLDGPLRGVTRIEKGVNALYRLDGEAETAVLKTPLYATEAAFLAEPAVLERIGRGTPVPVPEVLATLPADDGPLDTPSYVMAFVEGRDVDHVPTLSPATRDRLVREAATHLAAIHDLGTPDRYGQLTVEDGQLVVAPAFDSWCAQFDAMAEDVTAALGGDGPLTDAEPRFADLASEVRAALVDASAVPESPAPSLVVRDYRLANLVLGGEDADPLVRGVLDTSGLVGDALLDVAKAEAALVDLPLGGTDEAATLRETLRATYAERRGCDPDDLFDQRYPCYRLYARAYRLKAFDYAMQFTRETDADAVAERSRRFVADRLAAVRATG
ncbi:phosphotransferase family protein [Halomarina oriensis]|uniref:Phosphotransferase n=1 Tax=Halomarina oriensis TaxID=671145 RepID=A0A6B0GP91_9EURY|nr:phosphotransferase [Halomarina oriensis]MWG35349.1 phosphotransferase [Halomarina oriensis]